MKGKQEMFDGPVVHFGKYKGRAVSWVADNDPDYIVWACKNVDHFLCPKEIYLDCLKNSCDKSIFGDEREEMAPWADAYDIY